MCIEMNSLYVGRELFTTECLKANEANLNGASLCGPGYCIDQISK
jgi:hypothetical protein